MWIEHNGDGIPSYEKVDIRFRDGKVFESVRPVQVSSCWTFDGIRGDADIVAYRIHEEKQESALDVQISGDHYKNMKIQPVTYIDANGLDFLAGSVVKYITRHKLKGGKTDVEKAMHFCKLILELQYEKG